MTKKTKSSSSKEKDLVLPANEKKSKTMVDKKKKKQKKTKEATVAATAAVDDVPPLVATSEKKKKKPAKPTPAVKPRADKKKKTTPAEAAKKDFTRRNTKKIEEKTQRAPRALSTSVKRERKQWTNIRKAQLEDKTKVAFEPLRRMVRQAYSELSENANTKVKVERMQAKAEKLLLEQGLQFAVEWCSEVQRSVELAKRDMPVDSDLAAATYLISRTNGMVPPPCQQPVGYRYSDFPESSVKHIAKSTMRSVNNLNALGLLPTEEGAKCYKDAKNATRKRNRTRARLAAASD